MKKENMKLFIKKHWKEIILIGGTVMLTSIVIIARKALSGQTETIDEHIDTSTEDEETSETEGYDIWAIIGTKCSQELLNDMENLVQKENKTIYFDHYEDEDEIETK